MAIDPPHDQIAAVLGLDRVTPIGDGFNSLVVRADDGRIIRVARTATAARVHRLLGEVLPALAPRLPVAIPVPTAIIPPSAALPYGALVYPALPGTVAEAIRLSPAIARRLALFLVALHGIDPGAFPAVPRPDDAAWHELRAVVARACAAAFTREERRALDAWWERFLAAPERQAFAPALCHGDLWHENLLLDDAGQRITGVLDWETLTVGDPAQDLAPLRHAGDAFARATLEHYVALSPRRDLLLARRVQWFWEAREFSGLRWAIEQDDAEELADAVAKIRRGPILRVHRDGG
jgi:aminoglycoside phosphotransferase (APT) family kinase protein